MRFLVLLLVLLALAAAAYLRLQPSVPDRDGPAAEPALDLPAGGVRVSLAQRSDAEIPGSGGRLQVHIGDITRKQVELTLARRDGRLLIPATSVREGDRREFTVGDTRYHLTVVDLKNHLVGTDTAVLAITTGLSERDRIDGLLQALENPDLTFVRNGKEYTGKEAANHLRRKWKAAGDRIRTAEQFIEHLASRSSMTGRAYEVRLPNGTAMEAGAWLREHIDASE